MAARSPFGAGRVSVVDLARTANSSMISPTLNALRPLRLLNSRFAQDDLAFLVTTVSALRVLEQPGHLIHAPVLLTFQSPCRSSSAGPALGILSNAPILIFAVSMASLGALDLINNIELVAVRG